MCIQEKDLQLLFGSILKYAGNFLAADLEDFV